MDKVEILPKIAFQGVELKPFGGEIPAAVGVIRQKILQGGQLDGRDLPEEMQPLGERAVLRQHPKPLNGRGGGVGGALYDRQDGLTVLLMGGDAGIIAGQERGEVAVIGQGTGDGLYRVQFFRYVPLGRL